MTTVGISLKAARVNANLTQQTAAAMMGKNTMTIANWENGKTGIKAEDLSKLCEVYGVPVECISLPRKLSLS